MSLSGQYLEELSRRYKKQVEDLQQHLVQQMQAMRLLEIEHQHHQEMEKQYILQSAKLKAELDELTLQIRACIVVVIIAGSFMLLVFFGAILLCRSLRRDNKEILANYSNLRRTPTTTNWDGNCDTRVRNTAAMSLERMIRSKSFEDVRMLSQRSDTMKRTDKLMDASQMEQKRRPSEEVALILKEGDYNNTMESGYVKTTTGPRQRKISICYGSNYDVSSRVTNKKTPNDKRKKQKHSWHHLECATTQGTNNNDGM